ncbi:MAG: hypothetical protein OXR62_11355 [Ahrensia sp.]|nr:hypothetical protein [Ahrensia sp.]
MSLPQFDTRHARWDHLREAVTVPAGPDLVVITQSAITNWAQVGGDPDEAVEAVVEHKAAFAAMANTISAQDGIITVTQSVVDSRSWSVEPYSDGPEDSGAIYEQPILKTGTAS